MEFLGEHYQTWQVVHDGFLMSAKGEANKSDLVIRIQPNQPLEPYLDTLIHEGLHALDWSLEHDFIEHASEQLTKLVLWGLKQKGIL